MSRFRSSLVALACLLAGAVSLWCFRGPAPPADDLIDPEAFSATRAMQHIEVIAREPHPIGTAAHAAVRTYLEATIRSIGFEPMAMVAEMASRRGEPVIVHNLLVQVPGREPGPGVMVAAHYDSARRSPGASDDGVGVAALLETLRVLRHTGPLRRQVWVAFTDAEETGLLGARALVQREEIMAEVGLVLNFEARGTSGPALMFETSEGNAALIAAFAQGSPRPLATSLSQFVYRRMPNDTDFSIFARHGLAGLNFAFIGGHEHYHQPTDAPENVSMRSLQHTGAQAVQLVRYFGEQKLPLPRPGNAVFFNLPGFGLVHYPIGVAGPAGWLLAVGIVLRAWLARRHGVLRVGPLLRSVGAVGLTSIVAFAVGIAGAFVGAKWDVSVIAYVVSIALALVLTVGVNLWRRRRKSPAETRAGVLGFFLILSLLTGVLLPEGSYLFFWPTLLLAAGWAIDIRPGQTPRMPTLAIVGVTAGAMLFTALIAPLLVYVFLALPMASPVLVVLSVWALWLILAAAEDDRGGWTKPAIVSLGAQA